MRRHLECPTWCEIEAVEVGLAITPEEDTDPGPTMIIILEETEAKVELITEEVSYQILLPC